MKIITIFSLLVAFLGNSQTKIKLAKNPYSEDTHKIVLLKNNYDKGDAKFYDIKTRKIKYAWRGLNIDVLEFKSLLIDEKRNSYDITLQLDADGILQLDKHTTEYRDEILAFVFNDTIYQTQKIGDPILDGRFKIKNLTKKQKNRIVTTYKALPSYDLQKQLYSAIQSGKIKKIDSLLEKGAQLIDGGYKIGYNNFRNVIYELFRYKNSKYEKYPKTVNHLLKRGFIPKPKTIIEAIVFEDIPYVRSFFMAEKNVGKREKLLRKYVDDIIDNGSLGLLKLVEELGLKLEKVTIKKESILTWAVLKGDGEIISYLLKKKIPRDNSTLLVYACSYRIIKTVDVLLDYGIDINMLNENKDNLAQVLLDYEFQQDYYYNNFSLIKTPLLIERGLKVTTKNNKGQTVLHTLGIHVKDFFNYREGQSSGYSSVKAAEKIIALVKLIKLKGVDTKTKDNKGFTAYDYVSRDEEMFKEELWKKSVVKELLEVFK